LRPVHSLASRQQGRCCYGAAMPSMRTIVTLDPNVAEQLKALARQRNLSFKAVLNSVVRAGLEGERGGVRPYRAPSRPMGLRPGIDLTHALRLADALKDEEIVETSPHGDRAWGRGLLGRC
jgi:hypothetical protein